ncbi:hypothetical protein J2T20_000417 [Paenibacillus wynnii]|nr:hypothetical protein [Paenibacillus wynnii]
MSEAESLRFGMTKIQSSTNTVLHYHANIRAALQHALKTDLINTNPADKIERPKNHNQRGEVDENPENRN